jgi:predicted metal-dependent phosphoesterase TrpH
MGGEIDLHIHSNKSSDGDFSPFHIIQMAKEHDIKAISISDHDTVAAYPEALEWGKEADVEVIPSIELTTLYNGREFHLLVPFLQWDKQIVATLVDEVSEKRRQEARERVDKLRSLGFNISWKEVEKESGPFPPLGVTIAQVLLKKLEKIKSTDFDKYFTSENRLYAPYLFYKDYFMEGKPASVPRRNLRLLDILPMVSQTGGVPVLAHPGAYFQRADREDLIHLKNHGLEGLEVYSSYHDADQCEYYRSIAGDLDLIPTVGSDFHGEIKPHISLGMLDQGGYWMIERLRERRP